MWIYHRIIEYEKSSSLRPPFALEKTEVYKGLVTCLVSQLECPKGT